MYIECDFTLILQMLKGKGLTISELAGFCNVMV